MRITTGLYKGRSILTVRGLSVRPATDRVRQTIFNVLASRISISGARILDLFAGSGSLGLEALSRGAAWATFVEQSPDATEYIERNIATFGCRDRAEVLTMDAMSYLRTHQEGCDIVFADPPYGLSGTEQLPARIVGGGFVRPGGYLLIEHTDEISFPLREAYAAGPVKKFGRTVVTFFQPATTRIPGT